MPARAEWKALQTVHARAKADVRLVSPENDWNVIAASRFRLGQVDVLLPPLGVPAFGINYGEPLMLERTLHGRRTSGSVTPGQLAILPPDAETDHLPGAANRLGMRQRPPLLRRVWDPADLPALPPSDWTARSSFPSPRGS